MRIFLSYRREDSAGHTGRLFDSLRSRFGDDNVFLDLSDIDSGQVFADTIRQAIRSADVVLAVIGRDWLTCTRNGQRRLDDPNDLVRIEIATAIEQRVPVIAVLVDGTQPPGEQVLPAPLQPLAQRDAHDISDERWAYDVERLVTAIQHLSGSKGGARWRRWAVAAAILAGIALAGAAAAALYPRPGDRSSPGSEAAVAIVPHAALEGTWSADVTYPWGVKQTERFVLTVDGDTLRGTAGFLGVPRGIVDGAIEGDRIRFQTRTTEILGDEQFPITHRYTGRFTSDTIELTMQSEGRTTEVPITFSAARVAAP